jgi:CHAT domain-containing protein/tetratricopeptide (TPR) repeat protein
MKGVRFVMTRKRFLPFLLLVFCLPATRPAWAQLKPGVVVEAVLKNSEAQKAGLQPGDVLLGWNRGAAQGEIESPFDVSLAEIEQAPRGNVTLEGLRGTEKRAWSIGPDDWGVKTRPQLAGNLLSLYLESAELAKLGKTREAAERWRRAAVEAQKESPPSLNTWLFFRAASLFADEKQWNEADDAYQHALEPASEPSIQAQLFRAWAATYTQRDDLKKVEDLYQKAVVESRKVGAETLLTAANMELLGGVLRLEDQLQQAREECRQALAIQQKVAPDSLPVARTLATLGLIDLSAGDSAGGKDYNRQALLIAQRVAPRSLQTAKILLYLGVAEWYSGNLDQADDSLQRALALQQEFAAGSLDLAITLNNLGNVANLRGDQIKADSYYRKVLAIREKLAPGSIVLAGTLSNLGNVAMVRHDLAMAEKYYGQALVLDQKLVPGSLSEVPPLLGLALVSLARDERALAQQYLVRALAIEKEKAPKSHETAYTLTNMGALAESRADWVEAEEDYEQALKIADGLLAANDLDGLGNVARQRGDLVKAEECYRRALAIEEKERPGSAAHAGTLAEMAALMRQKHQLEEASRFYDRALNALESQTARLGGSEQVRAGFRANYAEYYTAYIDLLVSQKQPEQAFQVLERLRARTLLETLAAAQVDIRKGVDPSLLDQERALKRLFSAKSQQRVRLLSDKHTEEQLAALDKEIKDVLDKYQDLEDQIRTSSPTYAALTRPQPLGVKEVQERLLDGDTMLLEYALGEERSYLFVVTPTSLNTYALPKGTDIQRAAHHAYDLLTTRTNAVVSHPELDRQMCKAGSDSECSQAIAELSHLILGPVAEELPGKRLLIVSDGALQYIPFSALPIPSVQSKTAVPLIAEHEIVNLPSASVLAVLRREQRERKPASRLLAVLADPVFVTADDRVRLASPTVRRPNDESRQRAFSDSSAPQTTIADIPSDEPGDLDRSAQETGISGNGMFPRLPFTRREADAIYSITEKNDAFEALDFDASKTTALSSQLKDYRIVHFATHGLLNNDHPELSGLVFSLVDKQGNSQDGFLRMLDIYNMELNADLVVLSACQTALGKEIGEEGLIGLTRAFMYAGAPRVVASLWKVDDEATAALMKKFYEGMLREHQTPAQALRAAQQWMRTQKPWQSPYYWAGFVLQGEWK